MANKTKFCQGKDSLERMNFLYQAGTLMAGRSNTLSCYYGLLCKSVAKKSVLRMEPNIKRTICKNCGLILKPDITAEISMDPKNKKCFQILCMRCKKIAKRFMLNENYDLWLDNPKSIKESIHFENGGNMIVDTDNAKDLISTKNKPNKEEADKKLSLFKNESNVEEIIK